MNCRRLMPTVALIMAITAAHAQTVHFLGDLDTDITSLPADPGGTCFFGNLRTPGALEPFGADIFSMHAEIDSVVCGCDEGWLVSEIHILLANPTDGPLTDNVLVAVDGQGWATYPSGCLEPHQGYGGELFDIMFDLTLPGPGYWELVIEAASPCAYFSYEYFLKIFVPSEESMRLVVDADGARECEVLEGVHIGERWWWSDLYWQNPAGAPIWWVEAQCCENPVAVEPRSWSDVRALYR